MHVNITSSSPSHRTYSQKFLVFLTSPYRHSLHFATTPLKVTDWLWIHHSKKCRGLRSGSHAGYLNGCPCSVHCLPKVCIRCCLTILGHLQTLVYSDSINNLQVLQQSVETACWEIWAKPGISEEAHLSVWWRAGNHIDMHGNHIQHVL